MLRNTKTAFADWSKLFTDIQMQKPAGRRMLKSPSPTWVSLRAQTGDAAFHPKRQHLAIVYVDDFKMAGPTSSMDKGWELIRKGISTGNTEPVNRYLGCAHIILDAAIPKGSNPPHGSIPKPPPKSKPAKDPTDIANKCPGKATL